VDIVHTPFRGHWRTTGHQKPGNLGGRIQRVDSARSDSDDEVEAFIRSERWAICGEAERLLKAAEVQDDSIMSVAVEWLASGLAYEWMA
jgi:hypothetical protein